MRENRGLSPRGPGSDSIREKGKSALVGKEQRGSQLADFFLMRGQVTFFHCSMAFSSRSMACRRGR